MQRNILVAGNWKMNGSLAMTDELMSGIVNGVAAAERIAGVDLLVCPALVHLQAANRYISDSLRTNIALGAQTVNALENGAHTGEVSLSMLRDLGCRFVLLGHSERRELYGETNAQIAEKFAACVADDADIAPILCIGESLSEREAGQTEDILSQQIDAVLDVVGIQGFKRAIIAYEPIWAIGTGVTASPEQAQTVHAFIRTKLSNLDSKISASIQILYGGSMRPSNAFELLSQPDIDGGLVGGASLSAESFLGIWQAAREVVSESRI